MKSRMKLKNHNNCRKSIEAMNGKELRRGTRGMILSGTLKRNLLFACVILFDWIWDKVNLEGSLTNRHDLNWNVYITST